MIETIVYEVGTWDGCDEVEFDALHEAREFAKLQCGMEHHYQLEEVPHTMHDDCASRIYYYVITETEDGVFQSDSDILYTVKLNEQRDGFDVVYYSENDNG